MLEIHPNDAEELMFDDSVIDELKQVGGLKRLLTHQAAKGQVLEYIDNTDRTFYYLDEIEAANTNLKEIAANLASHYEADEHEIELYRWGIEKPVEANQDTFGLYRILITNKATGFIDWYREAGKTIKFSSLDKARKAIPEIMIASPVNQVMVV